MRANIRIKCLFSVLLLAGLMFSCQGKLSKEQREQMKEAREERAIKRLTDQEIVQAALETGRLFRRQLETGQPSDSLSKVYEASVREYSDTLSMEETERELWQAYEAAWLDGQEIYENVQRAYPDYLYYTYPMMENDTLQGMVSVRLSRKALIVNQ